MPDARGDYYYGEDPVSFHPGTVPENFVKNHFKGVVVGITDPPLTFLGPVAARSDSRDYRDAEHRLQVLRS